MSVNKHLEDTEQVGRMLQEEQRDLKKAGRGVFSRASRTGSCGRRGSGVVMPADRAGRGYKKGGAVESFDINSILDKLNGSDTLKGMLFERLEQEHKTYQMAIGRAMDEVFAVATEAILEVAEVMVEQQDYIASLQGRVFALEANLNSFVSAVSKVINLGSFKLEEPTLESIEPVEVAIAIASGETGQQVVECTEIGVSCNLASVDVGSFVDIPVRKSRTRRNKPISALKDATKEELYQVVYELELDWGRLPSAAELGKHDSIFHTRMYTTNPKYKYWSNGGEFFQAYSEWKANKSS